MVNSKLRTTRLPKKYHDAVTKWRDRFIPDYKLLIDNWEKFFPKDPKFQLCAYRSCDMCSLIECGLEKGKEKYETAAAMHDSQAHHVLGQIKAQASTEFGSIQQHLHTLSRAQTEQDQFWVLRMMAEELRHGYQMLHLLLEDDWSGVAGDLDGPKLTEEILSMTTGNHVLGAFNIDFDSFVDNIVFCALIDRVGKYQLDMQKISAYKPMAESIPQMLKAEAFHLLTGVIPLRRWASEAAKGSVYVTMDAIQRSFNKWVPRGLEMFGDERGGGTNFKYGLKNKKNAEAQAEYYAEIGRLVRDLNLRYVTTRLPALGPEGAKKLITRVQHSREREQGIEYEDLLSLPHMTFFRRRGVPAFSLQGVDGETIKDVNTYLHYLTKYLPQAYLAGRDFMQYVDLLRKVAGGTLDVKTASSRSQNLRRVGGVCPCSRSVRWVKDDDGEPTDLTIAPAGSIPAGPPQSPGA
ncbi:MAG: hypothetical protein ACYS22_20195 [Planctomycetota bacterium]|jgi:1,2-phenylacetyl-CoA epoxidase catalytic subunit